MPSHTPRIRILELGHDQLAAFDAAPGERVGLLFGAAWLTQEGEPGDSFLRPGDELTLRGGRVLVSALGQTRLHRLADARPAAARHRLAHGLRRWATRLQLGPTQPEPVA